MRLLTSAPVASPRQQQATSRGCRRPTSPPAERPPLAAEGQGRLEARARQLEEEFQARREELEAEYTKKAAALDADRRSLERGKAQQAQTTGHGDVISLSLGGERHVDVKRATLTQCEDSLLGLMFSGRWDAQLDRDQAGRVLLDFNPALAMPLIDYLRARRANTKLEPVPPPVVPPGAEQDFQRMVGYYGLQEFVFGRPVDKLATGPGWCWDRQKSDGQYLRWFPEDPLEVAGIGSVPIFATAEFSRGAHTWAVKLLSNGKACIGIGTPGTLPSMGQPFGETALVYNASKGRVDGALLLEGLPKAREHDVIGVRLDIDASTLAFFKNGVHLVVISLDALKGCSHVPTYTPIMALWGGDQACRARLVSTTSVQ